MADGVYMNTRKYMPSTIQTNDIFECKPDFGEMSKLTSVSQWNKQFRHLPGQHTVWLSHE